MRKTHGYVLPKYLKSEDPLAPGSGRTTAQLPRGTFGPVPEEFRFGNYSFPENVRKEPIGSHAHTTPQLPDGTVGPIPAGMEEYGTPWDEGTLESNGLGSLEGPTMLQPSIPSGDPIAEYGVRVSGIIMSALNKVAPADKAGALRRILNEVDPKLNAVVQRELSAAKGKGADSPRAVKHALSSAFQRGLVNEFIRLGQSKKVVKTSQLGLALEKGKHNNYVLGRSAEASALGSVKSFFSGVLDKIGGAACSVAGNSVTPLSAGAAGAFYGGPAGASLAVSGVGIAAAACAPDPPPPQGGGYSLPGATTPSWALPAAVGGGLLFLFIIGRK